MNDQLRQRGAESAVRKWQLLGRRLAYLHPRQPLPYRRGKRSRRFRRGDRRRAGPVHQLSRQRPRPAARIQYPLASTDPGKVSEQGRQRLRVPPMNRRQASALTSKLTLANLSAASPPRDRASMPASRAAVPTATKRPPQTTSKRPLLPR